VGGVPGRQPLPPASAIAQVSTLCRRYLAVSPPTAATGVLGIMPIVIGLLMRAVPSRRALAGKPGYQRGRRIPAPGPDHRACSIGGQLVRELVRNVPSTPEPSAGLVRPAPISSPISSCGGHQRDPGSAPVVSWPGRTADARPCLPDQVAAAGGDNSRPRGASRWPRGAVFFWSLSIVTRPRGLAAAGSCWHRPSQSCPAGAAPQRKIGLNQLVLDSPFPGGGSRPRPPPSS